MLQPDIIETHLRFTENAASQTNSHKRRINLSESPLTWLHARKHLSDRQLAAGELLRRDYEHAGLGARVTMNWDAPPLHGNRRNADQVGAATNAALSAKKRFFEALDEAGPGLADILWRVACAGEGVGMSERALGWPARAGKLVLGFALDRIATYYKVP